MFTFVFAYGTLKHDIDPPKTLQGWTSASVNADCYDSSHHEYPLAVNFDASTNDLFGEVIIFDEDELLEIDKREDHREYERERIKVTINSAPDMWVWVYVWRRPIPASAKMISEWRP